MSAYDIKDTLFNIDLIIDFDPKTMLLQPIKSLQVFEPSSTVFKRDGLFSLSIFGPLGSAQRNRTLAYIDLNISILHPLVYRHFCNLKSLYLDIMASKAYVKFDTKIKDFVLSKPEEGGQTGYHYFITHMEQIEFNDNNSEERKHRIQLIKKYGKKDKMITKWLVLPAGMRDYTVSEDGRPSKDEINDFYTGLIATSNMLANSRVAEDNIDLFDAVRFKLQRSVLEIYSYIENMLDGKSKFIQGKWAKRSIAYGTRNVITPSLNDITNLDSKHKVTINHSTLGLYQYLKAIFPITVNKIKGRFLNYIFKPDTPKASLVNKDTLRFEEVDVDIKVRDSWLSSEGINIILNKFILDDTLRSPVKIQDHYALLLYDLDKEIRVIRSNDQITEDMDKSKLRPITYVEMFYIAIYDCVDKYPGFFTRYPVTGLGSIYPSKVYLKTTTKGRLVTVYDGVYEEEMPEFPILKEEFTKSMSPNFTKLKQLDGDYDGDSIIGNIYWRFNKNIYKKNNFLSNSNMSKTKRKTKLAVRNKHIIYNYGYINIKDFPRGKLIKVDGNKEFYEVPDGIEILTIWNGKEKWVTPESYSVHKNLTMLAVKTHKGNTVECSTENTIITLGEDLEYKRTNPVKGMCIPRSKKTIDDYTNGERYKRTITCEDIRFNLNNDLGYLIGAIIGDGWVNPIDAKRERTAIMLASNTLEIKNKITSVLTSYGYNGNPYSISNPHEYEGFQCESNKHTWFFKPVANLLKYNIGHTAYNKKLPEWWANTGPGFRWGLLSGLLDTDGTLYIDKKSKRITISYTTVSQTLAYDFIALCNTLGIIAGLSIHKRKSKETFEYYINISNYSVSLCKKKLKLLHPEKAKRLEEMEPNLDPELFILTPNCSYKELERLRQQFSFKNDRIMYDRVCCAMKKAKLAPEGIGGYFNRLHFLEIAKSRPEFFKEDIYWSKFLKIVENKDIEWEVIDHIGALPDITEAYDLTVPPYNTFVLQNGIIVYDTCSFNIVFTEESVKEINDMFNNPDFYLLPDNSFLSSSSIDINETILKHMTE